MAKQDVSRSRRRAATKFHVCPDCAVTAKGWHVWGYHGKGGKRPLLQHRIRAHGYKPKPTDRDALRRYV